VKSQSTTVSPLVGVSVRETAEVLLRDTRMSEEPNDVVDPSDVPASGRITLPYGLEEPLPPIAPPSTNAHAVVAARETASAPGRYVFIAAGQRRRRAKR